MDNVKVNVGEILMSRDLVEAIEMHMDNMLTEYEGTEIEEFLLNLDFGVFVQDYLLKNDYKLLKE